MEHESAATLSATIDIDDFTLTATPAGKGDCEPAAQKKSGNAAIGPIRAAEASFYRAYGRRLNPYPSIGETLDHLRDEAGWLETRDEDWRFAETAINIYLLACAAANGGDEFLRGPALRLPRRFSGNRAGRAARAAHESARSLLRRAAVAQTLAWRKKWLAALDAFLAAALIADPPDRSRARASAAQLAALSKAPLPADLLDLQIGVPSPFRRLDMTHQDVLALGRRFAEAFPDRAQPVLLIGLRTSGSYFAPLLRAFLHSQGYGNVEQLTIQPDKGLGGFERRELKRCAEAGFSAVITDDPPRTAGTLFQAFDVARRAGFPPEKLKLLVPVHSDAGAWRKMLPDDAVVTLDAPHWRLREIFRSGVLADRIRDYLLDDPDVTSAHAIEGGEAEALNAGLKAAGGKRGDRLKKIFKFRLTHKDGREETRLVLAKSVGWGWLGYHGYLAGDRLAGFVAPVLGLRDGVLFCEWISAATEADDDRRRLVETAAAYVARRAKALRLAADPVAGRGQERHLNGLVLLTKALARAYGGPLVGALAQPSVARALRASKNPCPTLIDGRMDRSEWVAGPRGWLKKDFEQHGMGKAALNLSDPAFDLADAILKFELTPEEERKLIGDYVVASGDSGVESRLMTHKILAGLWELDSAREDIFAKRGSAQARREHHDRFMRAWHFLIVHSARFCGGFCDTPAERSWRGPLIALDVDGVIDRRLFGFPLTTPAGVEALSLLHRKGFCVTLNTARSIAEVKAYCEAYALAGGVAEYGAYLWDALNGEGRVLISPEALRQLDELRRRLRETPGVFIDERHQYSVRAFTYQEEPNGLAAKLARSARAFSVGDGAVAPLSPLLIEPMIAEMGLDLLHYDNSALDTTITAKAADKGAGLAALRDWRLADGAETIAVGDSHADLAMFRIASRCYAPANIASATQARLLGCRIVARAHQGGLLEIARAIAGEEAPRGKHKPAREPDFLFEVLRAADENGTRHLFRFLLNSATYRLMLR
ncbi:HAD hydrolase family protein [Rhodoblastus sp.]|uniref:HAD hydrolase family protein n=1 Tax=Rhodoblastus sp. TaxID=1962975 RepID=UPI0026035BFA|nr:HAD hydrolase family protein [Rhodoblastus sp.]